MRPTIDYLNARRAILPASGGSKQNHRVEYAPDDETDGYYIAMKAIGDFSLQAELSRQVQAQRLGIPQTQESYDEIPF